MFLLIALFLVLSCAAPKMVILLQEPVLSKKYFQETYAKYDEEGNKTIDSLLCSIIELKPHNYYPGIEYKIDWIKLHPSENVFLVQISGSDSWRKTNEISCVQLDNFQERWHLTLHEKGNISVEDVIFIDSTSVILVNNQNEMISLNLNTGNELWRIEAPKTINIHYFAETNRLLVRNFSGSYQLLHAATGDTVWSSYLGTDYPGEPVLRKDELFIMSGGLHKYDFNDGQLWSIDFDTHYKIDHTVTDVAADVVVSLLFGRATSSGSTPPDFYYTCFSLPQIIRDTIYVASQGQIYAIDNETSEIYWQTEKTEDIDIIHEIKIHDGVLYGKCGGYTLFLNGKGHVYSYKTRGSQGIIAFRNNKKLWFFNSLNKDKGEASIIQDFFVRDDTIIIISEYEIVVLNKENGNISIRLAAEDLRIGNISSCMETEQGFIINGSQGISLLDKNSLNPLWSRYVPSMKPEFCFLPSEKVNVTFWKSHELVDLYNKTFYNDYFEYDSLKNLIFLLSESEGLIGLNALDGSVKLTIPMKSSEFYVDFNRKKIFKINNYSLSILDLTTIYNEL
jgi:outer membrane protein assembly factor BamB